jgi:hypothetical protein
MADEVLGTATHPKTLFPKMIKLVVYYLLYCNQPNQPGNETTSWQSTNWGSLSSHSDECKT